MDEAKISSALDVYLKCLQGRDRAEDNVQEALAQLRGAAEASTFELKGQWYQIRNRKGQLYLCELDGKPKGRPKKTPEQKERDRAERERLQAEQTAEDTGGCTEKTMEERPSGVREDFSPGSEDHDSGSRENEIDTHDVGPEGLIDREAGADELGSAKDGLGGPVVLSDVGGSLRNRESGEQEIPEALDAVVPSIEPEEE